MHVSVLHEFDRYLLNSHGFVVTGAERSVHVTKDDVTIEVHVG